jgi:hypothetical protein
MKRAIVILSAALLLLNGAGAIYGGLGLITDPTGSKLQMPLSYLDNSPFNSYLIPGIILLAVNGIFSFACLAALLFRYRRSHLLVLIQGILLSGWIMVQVIMLKMFYAPMHLTFLVIGLCLAAFGIIMGKAENPARK